MKNAEHDFTLLSKTQRIHLTARLKHLGTDGHDSFTGQVLGILRTVERKHGVLTSSRDYSRDGRDKRVRDLAFKNDADLTVAADAYIGGLRRHKDSLKARLLPPTEQAGTGPASVTDLRRELSRQTIWQQLAGLDQEERILLANSSKTPADVRSVLEDSPSVIKRTEDGGILALPLIPAEDVERLRLQRARATQPELAAQVDELDALEQAATSLVMFARHALGELIRPQVAFAETGADALRLAQAVAADASRSAQE